MTYSEGEIRRQLSLGEDSHWEFKQIEFTGSRPRSPRRDDLADEIAAFANADGGVVLCGITDAGEVQGMSREQIIELDSLLVEVSSDAIRPAVRIRTHHEQLDDKRLLLVEVPEGESLHESPSGSYVRVGGTKRKMTSDEGLRLAQRRGQARFRSFDEQTLPETGFGTLDESLWKPLLTAEGAANPELALGKLALLLPDEAGIPRSTIAGVLLCTRNPEQWLPNACISATHYQGKDRASGQIDAQEIAGPLNRQIADAVAFAIRNMHVAARKEPARVNLPQYSEKALFEAVVNAVAHRDYSMRASKIRLSMFEDRLEIQSPGSLPNNLTIDSMATRQATRNEVLTSVLGRMSVGGVQGSEDRRYFHGASRRWSSHHPARNQGAQRETARISNNQCFGSLPHHACGSAGGEPCPRCPHRALRRPTLAWCRSVDSFSKQDLEARNYGRGRGGSRRPAHNSSPYDGVRCRTRVCRTSRTGMDPQPGSTHNRSSSPTGRW